MVLHRPVELAAVIGHVDYLRVYAERKASVGLMRIARRAGK
jgi:hypothetical protein